ncbi:retrovirus-related pol polyprotein from transposon TNT 1-94, partial [Tanacetum coccineum]
RIHQGRYGVSMPALYKKSRRNNDLYAGKNGLPRLLWRSISGLRKKKLVGMVRCLSWEMLSLVSHGDDEDVHDLRSVETEFPAIVFENAFTFEVTHSCEPTVSSFDDLDFFNVLENEFSAIVYNDAQTSKLDDLDYFKDFKNEFPAIPTVEENGVIRTKKYAELSAAEKIQADCDMKATNIILQGKNATSSGDNVYNNVDKLEWLNATTASYAEDSHSNNAAFQSEDSSKLMILKSTKEENVNPDKCDLEPINKELENSVAKLLSENERLVVQIVLGYLTPDARNMMTGNRNSAMNFVSKFLGTVRFGNDLIGRIIGYGDYQLGNVIISRVYYVEGLGHNLFSVSQFCDADLEVAFWKNTCFIRESKKSSHQPKAKDTNQEKLYLLHMDLCGSMHVASINGKRFKNIQVRLKATVQNVRTDNGIEFVNQTLREWYENVGITHQTYVARTPQQNGVAERQNQTLVEIA